MEHLVKSFSDERVDSTLAHLHPYRRGPQTGPDVPDAAGTRDERSRIDDGGGYLERIVLRSAGRLTLLDVRTVDWIEAAGVYVRLHVGPKTHLYRASVSKLLQRLDPRLFVRVHRSAAVNPKRIRELQPRTRGDYTIILDNRTELLLSRSYRPALERWLQQRL